MGDLFLEVLRIDGNIAEVPIESAVCLVILNYLGCPGDIRLYLVRNDVVRPTIQINLQSFCFNLSEENEIPTLVSFCRRPVFMLEDGISTIAGLCAVLRQIVKSSGEQWRKLLGFREACLVACAEFSLWTKFCEVDLIECSKRIIGTPYQSEILPVELAQLEVHMAQPIRIHNIGKLKDKQHTFVEGPLLLLSDLIIAIPVFIVTEILQCQHSPLKLTADWLNTVKIDCGLGDALVLLDTSKFVLPPKEYILPPTSNHSLYKSDPKRYRPRSKIFTQQGDIEESMVIVESILLKSYEAPLGHDTSLDIENIPKPDVPQSRLDRKLQQLSNLTKAVLKVAQDNDTIVDFCSGSGHLGLILAHCLPNCTVVLLDNKDKSLSRARRKVADLMLKNVYILQTNLDYFIGQFQVGVSLHACGVASDLVILKCLQNKANFVVCPCCYGSIQSNHILTYPQSLELREAGLTERGLLVLGHCADQAGTDQGDRGMQIVDTDRCLLAEAHGYSVSLAKLIPPSCTPKNNLIVAVFDPSSL